MSKEALVAAVKNIMVLGKAGRLDDMYLAYKDLFCEEWFEKLRSEDQRQALKLMVLMKGAPNKPTEAMKAAHRAALAPLTELVSTLGEPIDHELLGVCHVVLGNEESAMSIFKAGLVIERERSPGSDLCGELMKRVSML